MTPSSFRRCLSTSWAGSGSPVWKRSSLNTPLSGWRFRRARVRGICNKRRDGGNFLRHPSCCVSSEDSREKRQDSSRSADQSLKPPGPSTSDCRFPDRPHDRHGTLHPRRPPNKLDIDILNLDGELINKWLPRIWLCALCRLQLDGAARQQRAEGERDVKVMSQFFPFRHCWFVSSGFFQPPAGAMFFSPLPQCRPSPPPNSPASHFPVRFRPSVEKSSKQLAEHASLLGLVGRGNPLGGGTVIGVPPLPAPDGEMGLWSFRRLLARWHAGSSAVTDRLTSRARCSGSWMDGLVWRQGQAICGQTRNLLRSRYASISISRRVRPDGRPTTRPPLTCPPPPIICDRFTLHSYTPRPFL